MSTSLNRIASLIADRAPLAEQYEQIGRRLADIDLELSRLGLRSPRAGSRVGAQWNSGPTIRQRILDLLHAAEGQPVKLKEIARAIPDSTSPSITVTLRRMMERGEIVRPGHGIYAIAAAESEVA